MGLFAGKLADRVFTPTNYKGRVMLVELAGCTLACSA